MVADPVARALAEGAPVVALETALVTHGLPQPDNVDTALAMEAAVRGAGALPATVGIVGGRPVVGLEEDEIRALGRGGAGAAKASVRDLPVLAATGGDGGTTVAATIRLASAAGIAVMATGGIGGVHRGHPFDVSADLPELARLPVCVVCSGAKAILDLPLTREWLETHAVTVVGYGTDELPAFYSRESGISVDARADTPQQVAAIVRARRDLGIEGAVLVGVPPPAELALPGDEVEDAVRRALDEAERAGIRGADVTPHLLGRVAEHTGGRARRVNIALLVHNARIGGQIAVALASSG